MIKDRSIIDWKIATLTIVSTLVLLVDHYHAVLFPWQEWFPDWTLSTKGLDRTILYLIIPLVVILFLFREKPGQYGFALGDWKAGIWITLAAILLVAPILLIAGTRDQAIREFYQPQYTGLPWNTLVDLFGWEFLFRGFLLFGYARKFGPDAIWIQAVPFALAHMGKPELETLTTIFGGFAFGWVAWRTRSFLYPLLIHWFVASFIIIAAAWK